MMEIESQTSSSSSDTLTPSHSYSYSSSSSFNNASIFPIIVPPVETELHAIDQYDEDQRLRFFSATKNYSREEWSDIETRFDRLATSNGSEQVLKWSDFGLCIGMERSPEFANELLVALRGTTIDKKTDISKGELYGYWRRLSYPSFDSRIRIFFDLFDKNKDGKITELDIKQVMMLSASTNKLSLTHEEAESSASLVMEYLDSEKQGFIEINQFETLFRITLSKSLVSSDKHTAMGPNPNPYPMLDDQVEEKSSKAEIMFRSHWRQAWIVMLWVVICAVLFGWKFIQYRHRTAFEVMGYCLSTAKGAAETLKLNMALILLPVCRNTITWIRSNPKINSVIPFNDNINFHKVIAGGIVVGVILHGGTHLACDFPRICNLDSSVFQRTIASGFGYHQPSYLEILATTEVATGIAMVVLMAIAFALATKWTRRKSLALPRSVRHVTGYNAFWYSHHLFVPVYVLLLIHSMFLFLTNNVSEKTTWMYIAIPILIYTGERVLRAVRSGSCEVQILKANFYPGKVLSLRLQKPEGFKHHSGMYIFIQCPQISTFEWHPFSLTSAPEDDHLSVHIRTLGDWSYRMYNLFQEVTLNGSMDYPKIHLDGPYGAASQDHVKYDTVVLIGLGIGATPFISVLKDVVDGIRKEQSNKHRRYRVRNGPTKAYLYWVTREQSSFDWFREVMKEVSKPDQKQSIVEVHNFLTSVYREGDARSALISAVQALHQAKHGIDIISRTPVRTHFARPNWFSVFSNLSWRHRGAKIGVFYCGPPILARELERLCTKFSTKTTTRFVFHKETY